MSSPSFRAAGRRVARLAACVVLLAACGQSEGDDSERDAGAAERDGETPRCDEPCAILDASQPDEQTDAAVAADAGADAPLDAQTALDASEDARQSPDAGLPDAGEEFDAGDLQAVSVRFRAELGRAPFACGKRYESQGSSAVPVTPIDFRFFVQEVRLTRADGTEVPVTFAERAPWQTKQVALIDFEDATGVCVNGNAGTNDVITGWVPPGDYQGIVVVQGVPAALNHADPARAPAPLRNAPSTLWSWALGYKFLLAEVGQLDPSGAPGLGLVHVGSAGCTGSAGIVACTRGNRPELRFATFDTATDVIVADLGPLFATLDLTQDNQCHAAGAVCAEPFARLGLSFATGQATPASQLVYRVE